MLARPTGYASLLRSTLLLDRLGDAVALHQSFATIKLDRGLPCSAQMKESPGLPEAPGSDRAWSSSPRPFSRLVDVNYGRHLVFPKSVADTTRGSEGKLAIWGW
jgi:hypothetical protein